MIEEVSEFRLGEIGEDDQNLDHLFSRVIGVAPIIEEEKKVEAKVQDQKNDSWSDLDVRDEVYSERPLHQRRRIRKVENKIWKNFKKSRNNTYIRMLENKVQDLEKEISKQRAINKTNQDYIKKLSLSEQIISGVFVGRSQIYERLETLTEQIETQQTRKQLIKEVTTLRYRLGVQGKDRIKALNHYFKEMVESFIPQCQRFLIYAACNEIELFSPEYIEEGIVKYATKNNAWRQEIMKPIQFTYEQRKTISNLKPFIMEEKRKYDNLVHQFFQTKKQLTQQAKKMQIVFDQFRAFMTPFQLSKILINIEKNKYRKQLNLQSVDSFWSYEFDQGCDGKMDRMEVQSLFATTAEENWT